MRNGMLIVLAMTVLSSMAFAQATPRVPLDLRFADSGSVSAQKAGWITFFEPGTGLSFRYPPGLHVRLRDPQKFGLPHTQTIVDLTGDTKLNPGTIVLRFLVKRGLISAGERTMRLRELHRVCKETTPIMLDGHEAEVCISAGRAAVHWSVEILQPRECTIRTLLGGADADQALPSPHDGEFPLLSIIRSVRFAASGHSPRRTGPVGPSR